MSYHEEVNRRPSTLSIYRPGMISLFWLPILCLAAMVDRDVFTKKCLVEVNGWDRGLYSRTNGAVGSESPYQPRLFHHLFLDSDKSANSQTLLQFMEEAKSLRSSGDTIHGVHLRFSTKMPYETFVQVFDFLNHRSLIWNSFYKNDVWIWNPKQISDPALETDTSYRLLKGCIDPSPQSFPEDEKIGPVQAAGLEIWNMASTLWKGLVIYWPCYLCFLALCCVQLYLSKRPAAAEANRFQSHKRTDRESPTLRSVD